MKPIKSVYLILLIFFSFTTLASAQLFQIGAGGGITQILAPDSYTNSIGDGGYGFSTEWNAGTIIKIGLPLLPITPRAYFLYHSLYGSEQFETTGEEESPNIDYQQSISEIGIGLQYNFVPLPAGFDPYVALDLAYNSFSALEKNGTEIPDTKVSRFGAGIGLGTEITIIPILDFDVYASYKMFNLIGKEDGEKNVTAFTVDVFVLLSFL